MPDNVVRLADQLVPAETTYLHKGRVAVLDLALEVRGRDQFLIRREGSFFIGYR